MISSTQSPFAPLRHIFRMAKSLWFIPSICFTLSSCFKDEPLNAEADIESVWISTKEPLSMFFQSSDTIQKVPYTDTEITFHVRNTADLSAVAPHFQLTSGATISPESGSEHDFRNRTVQYTVTSQDKAWKRVYSLRFVPTTITVTDSIHYDFEHYELEPARKKYYQWYETTPENTKSYIWATGNPGFSFSMSNALPQDYPSYPTDNGRTGKGVMLTTRSTGVFGEFANKRLAAGNLYLGTFDSQLVLTQTTKATRFGIPFTMRPTTLKGWYKYTPGAVYQDIFGKPVPNKQDNAAIYAVLYRNHDDLGNETVLYGDNVKTSQQIVAIADMGNVSSTETWTPFAIDFQYRQEIDPELLRNRGYSLSIVFSSSNEGDHFEGAIGSTLCIDDISIIGTTQE